MALDYNSVNNAFKTVFARHATAAEWNVHAAYPSGQAVMDVLYDTDAYKEQTLPVARLYTAVLGRDPEPAGLAYYIVHMRDQGLRLDQAAFGFLHSPEAQSNFGYVTANDAEFIQALYLTCLGREGEQAGVDFYLDRLSHGTDRATVAIWFSYSPENQARVGDKHYAAFDVARFTETGSVLDGYLRGADVFADANGNGTWDEGEARTTTDAKGQWTLTDAEGPLIVTGGIDISTNLPNTTVLKATAGSTVVNPLTSLQQALVASGKTGAQAQAAVIEAFGLDANLDLGSYDPLAVLFDANATPQEKAVALQVQAAATKLQNLVVTASTTLTGVAGSTNLNDADASP